MHFVTIAKPNGTQIKPVMRLALKEIISDRLRLRSASNQFRSQPPQPQLPVRQLPVIRMFILRSKRVLDAKF